MPWQAREGHLPKAVVREDSRPERINMNMNMGKEIVFLPEGTLRRYQNARGFLIAAGPSA